MKFTKTLALATLIAGSLIAGSSALQAQDAPATPPPAGGPPGGRGAGQNFDQIAKQLELTDDQKPKVKTILDDMRQ